MATFPISRNQQFLLMLAGCGGYDPKSRERRLRIARLIQAGLPDASFDPSDRESYDLSLLLEQLTDNDHADAFAAYLNLL